MTLSDQNCVPCRKDTAPLSLEQANELLMELPGWGLSEDGSRIERKFSFPNFVEAIGFVNKVGEIAETEGHHPDISFGWGYARIAFFTHLIKGLHQNDFIMAAKVDAISLSKDAAE